MSRAAVSRWFTSHVGHMVETEQRGPDGNVKWAPGPRHLAADGKSNFALNGSRVGMDQATTRFEMGEHGPILHWHDEDGGLIHSTHYKVADAMHPIPRVQHLMAIHGNDGLVALPSRMAPE